MTCHGCDECLSRWDELLGNVPLHTAAREADAACSCPPTNLTEPEDAA